MSRPMSRLTAHGRTMHGGRLSGVQTMRYLLLLAFSLDLASALPSASHSDAGLHMNGRQSFQARKNVGLRRNFGSDSFAGLPHAHGDLTLKSFENVSVDDVLERMGQFSSGTMQQFLLAGFGWTGHMMLIMSEIFVCQRSFSSNKESIVGSFELDGNSAGWVNTCSTIFLSGLTAGIAFAGKVSDDYGRRPVMLAGSACTMGFGFLSALANTPTQFGVARFFAGLGAGLGITNCYVHATGFAIGHYRGSLGGLMNMFACLGTFVIAPLAYKLRCWRSLLVVISAVNAYPLLASKYILESPRWLLAKGRRKEAEEILESMAQSSGQSLPGLSLESQATGKTARTESFFNGMRNANFSSRMVAMSLVWFSVGFTYFGLAFQIGSVPGCIFQNHMISVVADVAAIPLQILILAVMGRREALMSTTALAGLGCAAYSFQSPLSNPLRSKAALLLARLCVGTAYMLAYLYASELFPTSVRATAMSLCSIISRIGTMMVPLVAAIGTSFQRLELASTSSIAGPDAALDIDSISLGRSGGTQVGKSLSYQAFAITMAVSTAAVGFILPETRGQLLPDCLSDLDRPGCTSGFL